MILYDLVEPGLDTCAEPRHRTAGIRAADPLGADVLLAAVPGADDDADTAALPAAPRDPVPDPDRVADGNAVGCPAATRGPGPLPGPPGRHGVRPVAAVPEALPVPGEPGRRTGTVTRGHETLVRRAAVPPRTPAA
ncbi:hypothetical protein [Streptomyces roseolilacinus]|uniref:Uncharacterized protein n=1 Tax=Streptomyces roseolilacinus TaxID=66904 RepID=A0A918EH33_9ACTN|nr:hypothetical protein [Streptomyces roseolilacinus]GGP87036.1 hypothetical protein GCM10010249_00180 [Streptomyces roseolilacinus]